MTVASIAPKQVGLVGSIANQTVTGTVTVTGAIEQYRILDFAQTTAGLTLTLPNPVDATVQFVLDLINTGTASFLSAGVTVPAGGAVSFVWSGTAWLAAPVASVAVREVLSVTAQNTIANTVGTPSASKPIDFYVNGSRVRNGNGLAVVGQAVTVTAATLGFNVATTDDVEIAYYN